MPQGEAMGHWTVRCGREAQSYGTLSAISG